MKKHEGFNTLDERKESIICNSKINNKNIKCDTHSISGSVSQRACVYCGARVVLNPITDAYHVVHGPIGCASYTWDIRGSLTSDEEVYRNSFSTDLREEDIIFGGEKKLINALDEIVNRYHPKLIFVYATCVVGVIGDDIEAVCKKAQEKYGIEVIPVQSSGFAGNKKSGYKAGCNAILKLISKYSTPKKEFGINYLGDFNLAGEIWIIKNYLEKVGIPIITKLTGDSSFKEITKATTASLSAVQCAGSMVYLAKQLKENYGIPFIKVSFVGIEDTINSLRNIAKQLGNKEVMDKVEEFILVQKKKVEKELAYYRKRLYGKSAAIYVGGGFKAISLIKQFNELGMKTVMVGTQTGSQDEYDLIKSLTDEGTVILDDANPTELEMFIKEKGADVLVGGVKERPLAFKLGIAFFDHNHERKHPLSGFEGAINFAKELDMTINSPVWKYIKEGGKDVKQKFYKSEYESV